MKMLVRKLVFTFILSIFSVQLFAQNAAQMADQAFNTSNYEDAAIGGGRYAAGGITKIYGGNVTAKSNKGDGTGIGGGQNGAGGTTEICVETKDDETTWYTKQVAKELTSSDSIKSVVTAVAL